MDDNLFFGGAFGKFKHRALMMRLKQEDYRIYDNLVRHISYSHFRKQVMKKAYSPWAFPIVIGRFIIGRSRYSIPIVFKICSTMLLPSMTKSHLYQCPFSNLTIATKSVSLILLRIKHFIFTNFKKIPTTYIK